MSLRTTIGGPTFKRPRVFLCGLGLSTVLAAITVAVGTPANATTGDEVGLPVPERLMAVQWGHPLEGRTFLTTVSKKAGVISAILDIAGITEGEPEWFYGTLSLYQYVNGKPTSVQLSLYPFTYVGSHHVTAGIIPPASISEAHPTGVPIGKVTFTVAKPIGEIKTDSEEPKFVKGTYTMNGHGPYKVELKRGEEGYQSPYPENWPKAKQIGGK